MSSLADPFLPRKRERLPVVVGALARNQAAERAEVRRITAALDERIARLWGSPVIQDGVDILMAPVGSKPVGEAAVERLLTGSPKLGLLARFLDAGAAAYAAHYRENRALQRKHAAERRPLL